MTSRIPHLLEPYFILPSEGAHVVLTSVLGTSTNWIIFRYLYSYLQKKGSDSDAPDNDEPDINVVLVSFMRDFSFWKEGAGRLGIDLEGLARRERFVFVDGLTELFAPSRQGGMNRKGHKTLQSANLANIKRDLLSAVSGISAAEGSNSKTVLIIDQPDLLVAATANLPADSSTGVDSPGLALRNMLLDVQEQVYGSIFTVAADDPLVAAQSTGLEKETAAFTLSLVHGAEKVMGLRLLDTGSASDVSGVIRVTQGGGGSGDVTAVEEGEFLYFMGGDGGVKVFHRGQGS